MTKDPRTPDAQSFDAQLGLLDQLLGDYRRRLRELTDDPEDLRDQLERIEASLAQHSGPLEETESSYRVLVDRRRGLRKRLEEGRDRRSEIESMIERFDLLDRHYESDLARLRGIQEGGTLFAILGRGFCPLCGADAAHHRLHEESDANVEAVVQAAGSEIAKIEILRKELNETLAGLRRERGRFDRRLPQIEEELNGVASDAEQMANPLSRMRKTYAEFADKRGQVREASSLLETIRDMERRRSELEDGPSDGPELGAADGDLPAAVADEFAQQVETILAAWHFPQAQRVHFDSKSRDIVIAGKRRGARGKGIRAITHAAFSIGILEHCRARGTPHPGFVILDSPLLTYREPEGTEDDLSGTDLKDRFYAYLAGMSNDRQVLIVENMDPPSAIVTGPNVTFFSANPHEGRYGFFPGTPNALAKPDGAPSPAEPEAHA